MNAKRPNASSTSGHGPFEGLPQKRAAGGKLRTAFGEQAGDDQVRRKTVNPGSQSSDRFEPMLRGLRAHGVRRVGV